MAYNTKSVLKDKDGNPIAQYYNSETDTYEPVEGSFGGSKISVEGNELSLIPILDKLSQLTGTVLDESYRIANEIVREGNEDDRVALYDQLLIELDRISQITEQVPQEIADEIQILRDMDMLIRNNDLDGSIEGVIPLDAGLLGGQSPSHYATKQSVDDIAGVGRTSETVKGNADVLVTHKAENASKHITESGSNENGRYIKYDDGTMICWRVLGNINFEVGVNSNASIEYTFPASFIANPAVSHSGEPTYSSGSVLDAWINSSAISQSIIRIRVFNQQVTSVEEIRRLSYLAIGRWK